MGRLISLLFQPPPLPAIELPLAAKLAPGVLKTIHAAFELAYYRGVYDGVIAGVLLTLLFVPSIRSRAIQGAAHVVDCL